MNANWYTYTFVAICALKLSAKMWKPMWFDRAYFGDYKYMNIMLLQWLEVIMLHKISENITNIYTML